MDDVGWRNFDGFGWLTQQSSIPVAIVDLMHFISGLTEHNALKFGTKYRANENKTTKQLCENSSKLTFKFNNQNQPILQGGPYYNWL